MKDEYIEEFSARVMVLRRLKGVSARDMSLSLGQSHNYIHNIESQKNYPTMLNFFYICEYLKVTPREFFDYINGNPYLDSELFQEIKKLDGKSQEYFLALIRDVNNRPKSDERRE